MKKIKNPIIPGFYPDPTICRVEDDYYLACSSFELCPGIPIFHSRDLAHWEQIGNAMTPENGFHVEKNCMNGGVMAPTLRYYDGTFYIINTNFSDKGNYIVTAADPAGPWSEPHWLTDVPGIDASIFFDDDGTCYVMGTGNVWDNGAGVMERGIWLAKFDIENYCMLEEPVTIFNSALRVGSAPEAPHLYHVGDYYHLIIAEGGTEHYHSVMNARSKDIYGFYEGNPANPVLTHRHMGYGCPIGNVGHADLVELPDGSWYAVMLASRLIDGVSKNLGRETFLCPVIWERDWPLFSPETGKVEWEYEAPVWLPETFYEEERTGYGFEGEEELRDPGWVTWGRAYEPFFKVEDSKLKIICGKQALDEPIRAMLMEIEEPTRSWVSMLARRQRSPHTQVSCRMEFQPEGAESAGLAVIQAMNHQFHLEMVQKGGKRILRFVVVTADYDLQPYFPNFTSETHREVLGETEWDQPDVVLQIVMEGNAVIVRYGSSSEKLQVLCMADAGRINPEKVGCMTGTLLGMFASGNGSESQNTADFDWFSVEEFGN